MLPSVICNLCAIIGDWTGWKRGRELQFSGFFFLSPLFAMKFLLPTEILQKLTVKAYQSLSLHVNKFRAELFELRIIIVFVEFLVGKYE